MTDEVEFRAIKVRLNAAGRGIIELDGKRLRNCNGVSLNSDLGRATSVTLTLVAREIDFEIENVNSVYAETTHAGSESKEYVEL